MINSQTIEKFGPDFNRTDLLRIRDNTWQAVEEIRRHIAIGMTEEQAKQQAGAILKTMGAEKNWHKIIIRFAQNTPLYFSEISEANTILRPGDIFYIDIGPIWDGYEGDAGKSFVMGENDRMERLVADSEKLFAEMRQVWNEQQLSGIALYDFGARRAEEMGWTLSRRMDGHRLSDFPHQAYFRDGLMEIDFPPVAYAWVLEVHLQDPQTKRAAFFEDLLF